MRRALRALLIAVGVLLAACGVTGALALHDARGGIEAGGGLSQEPGGLALAHALSGHALVAACSIVAAIAFVLGLQGLLETGGRRLPAGLLFLLAPLVMSLALAADLTGQSDREASLGTLAGAQLDQLVRVHATILTGSLAASVAATAAVSWWLGWKGRESAE